MTTQVKAKSTTRPELSSFQQWWVLTLRLIAPSLRSGEVLTAILAPLVFTVGFFIPLQKVMDLQLGDTISYAQFLMPLIMLQSLSFTGITAAFRASTDAVEGINRRFGAMPIGAAIPLAARMASNMFRCILSVIAAIICGYVIGFRFTDRIEYTIGFLAFALLVGAALALGGDVLGSLSSSPEATTQILTLPQLILGLLSSGFAPVSIFPSYLQGFVRNQPVSQFSYALRGLGGDPTLGEGVTWGLMGPPLAWALGMIVVFVPISIRANSRRA